jgi:light-regulated signal transduction histidine kinase (bacteriophytochrome)
MSALHESIEVYVGEDGNVCIAHVDMSEDCFVAIPPEQVDILIQWLKERQAEAISYRDSIPTVPRSEL